MKSRAIQVLQGLPTGVWVLVCKTVLGCMGDRHSVVIQGMCAQYDEYSNSEYLHALVRR